MHKKCWVVQKLFSIATKLNKIDVKKKTKFVSTLDFNTL